MQSLCLTRARILIVDDEGGNIRVLEILDRLAGAGEFRDDETGQHTRQVGTLAATLARALEADAHGSLIEKAAPLHDLGKIGIPDRVLLKPGERWDGAGYPHSFAGAAIPWAARIVSVADVFDALSHDRPYRAAWPMATVIKEIGQAAGNQLDPDMARTFLSSCVGKSIERPAPPRRRYTRRRGDSLPAA